MTFQELYPLRESLSQICLKKIEDYDVGKLGFRLLHIYYIKKSEKRETIWKHIAMILARCFTIRNKIEEHKEGKVICYCSRPMVTGRPDHLQNFLRVINLLENKTVMVGTAIEGITLKNIKTLLLPFVWDMQLRKVVQDKYLRVILVRNIYSAYIDFLEYRNYEKKKSSKPVGLLLLEETIPSAMLLAEYFQKQGRKTAVLQHGLYAASEQMKYYLSNWGCDYMLAYSKYSVDLLEEVGNYPGEIHILGMYQYIGQTLEERNIEKAERIGIFLDGFAIEKNLEMINIVVEACKNTKRKIYIKLHPSSDEKEMEIYKQKIDMSNIVGIYSKKPVSIELEKNIDVMVCRNTTCFVEAVFQKIPAFIYNKESIYKGIKANIYFNSKEELSILFSKVEDGSIKERLEFLKIYLCGPTEPEVTYSQFFYELGWA